jgi:N-formylglutamate amidohydrolase
LALAAVLIFFSTGCRTTYYKTMERFGVYKRDLLKKNVQEARDEQSKAAEQFKDALTRLREMYQVNGGDLEKMYDRLQADFNRSETRANNVKERIGKVETVAADLFKEWEQEIEGMENSRLASNSREKLRATREKYQSLHAAMKRAEESMEPVIRQFKDQVLYLKHNLNAQAIGALKGETTSIENEIQQLIRDMNASIEQADAFIKGLE